MTVSPKLVECTRTAPDVAPAADCAAVLFHRSALTGGCANLGGNVYVYGTNAQNKPWSVAIQDPADSEGYVCTLSLSDAFVVTSGGYQRYFTAPDGTVYQHILDPKTGYPVQSDLTSVSVVTRGGFGGQGTIPLIGTPGLQPEKSTTYEVGLHYSADGFLSGSTTLFYNKFKDKITSGPGIPNCQFAGNPNRPGCLDVGNFPAVDLFGQSINIDEAVTRGVEVNGRLQFTRALSLSLNYTYTHSEQKSGAQEGLPLIGTPKHMANGNLRWAVSDVASVWARADIRSSRWRGENAQQDAVGDFRAYEVFHLGGTLQIAPQLRFAAAIYNILDTDYAVYVPYQSGANTVYTPAYSINQDGRRLWLSATVDF